MLLNENRLYETMEKHDLDVLIATAPENVVYASEVRSGGQWLLRGQVYVIIPRDSKLGPTLIAPRGEADLVVYTPASVEDVVLYGAYPFKFTEGAKLSEKDEKLRKLVTREKPKKGPLDTLIEVLKERNLNAGRIGLDEGNLTPAMFTEIVRRMPQATITEAYTVFGEIRMVKTREEVERLRKAVKATEKAIEKALEVAEIGMTEREIAIELEKTLVDEGVDHLSTCIGSGVSSPPNAQPTEKKLVKGDILKLDVGCLYKSYCSDIGRTAVLGSPTSKQERYYKAIQEGETRAIEQLKPGVKVSDVFKVAVDTVKKSGIPHYERHVCGHGIGIQMYDPPLVAPSDNTLLEAGMVLCIETPYVEIGFAGFIVEDTVLVTKDGFEFLSTLDRELKVI